MASDPPDPPPTPNIDPIIREMHDQNERGAAIIGGVFLEDKLRVFIELRWPPISNTVRNRLFTGYGPLSSFSAKIAIAHAMGVLNTKSKSDCDKIRLIRNDAAHIGTPFSFSAPENLKHLSAIHCIRDQSLFDSRSPNRARNQFTSAVKSFFFYLWIQEIFKKRFGYDTVVPDLGSKTPSKKRRTKSSLESKRVS